MRRVVVLGGRGLFGRTAAEELRALGLEPEIASRRPGVDVRVDANDRDDLRHAFREGDLVIDTAGPFQERSTALVDAAIDVGFDVVDINDDLSYAERVVALNESIDRAGIRVLSSCSSVSAISASIVQRSGAKKPVRLTGFLAPATKYTANPGSALSLIRSVGRPVRALRGGRLATLRGWREARGFAMPEPVGALKGRLFESADALLLPRVWPSLDTVELFVDPNAPGLAALLALAARLPAVRRLLERCVGLGTKLSRLVGSPAGGLGYEVEDSGGEIARFAVVSRAGGHRTPVAPAVLAARKIAEGSFDQRGLVPPDRHVDAAELTEYLKSRDIAIVRLE
ncbi:MAG: saccharopine dehydrogenase NADP-binding domain-containing protein [Planctomycetota bacterium]|nr:saccharopine dehydrogenase NADP-binding domain-containing protein [Planctomycetota bacterium]